MEEMGKKLVDTKKELAYRNEWNCVPMWIDVLEANIHSDWIIHSGVLPPSPPNIIRILENIRAVYTRNFNNRQIPKMDLSIENPNGKVYNWITAKYAAALNLIWQPSICLIRHPCYRSLASIIALFAHWIVHLPGAIDAASRFGFGESLFD